MERQELIARKKKLEEDIARLLERFKTETCIIPSGEMKYISFHAEDNPDPLVSKFEVKVNLDLDGV